ncbi:hypothetical protein [Bifidobacterium sp. ESL0704]|uniref:hypothetical protein n=1 Tax=Bifidobacterium sp. ESL0704 TaxID=2983219 RepID=UPI0023F68349|nr:hypothetical protein [Bifidobacterium sp. ESL0704]WEV52836.1 hypothetical protein OZX64_08270 [Bifidobacterium sp. ESL0704]
MSDEEHETRIRRLDERIADCERRISQAHEKTRESEKQAKTYDEASSIIINWNRQVTDAWQDLHQHVKGDTEWRQLEQDNEEREAGFRQTQNGCAETYDILTNQARRQHKNALDIRDEQESLYRTKHKYENKEKQGRGPWD